MEEGQARVIDLLVADETLRHQQRWAKWIQAGGWVMELGLIACFVGVVRLAGAPLMGEVAAAIIGVLVLLFRLGWRVMEMPATLPSLLLQLAAKRQAWAFLSRLSPESMERRARLALEQHRYYSELCESGLRFRDTHGKIQDRGKSWAARWRQALKACARRAEREGEWQRRHAAMRAKALALETQVSIEAAALGVAIPPGSEAGASPRARSL